MKKLDDEQTSPIKIFDDDGSEGPKRKRLFRFDIQGFFLDFSNPYNSCSLIDISIGPKVHITREVNRASHEEP